MPRALLNSLQDILFPPACAQCSAPIQAHGGICQNCWQDLHFLTNPRCQSCGFPFEYGIEQEDMICGNCLQNPPAWDAHRACLRYDEGCGRLISRLKYYDQTDTVQLLARWMQRTAEDFLAEDDLIIIPVPLHPLRLWRRKYNQAALLARELAKASGHCYWPMAMKRLKHRPPQASLARKARLKNMKGVFAVKEGYQQQIKGQTVLLVDDVLTTGATLNHCAATLKKAGAAKVFATTIAHTLLD